MLSKITIDLDSDNQPIIKVDYFYSEDVRDKMIKIFMESFGGQSNICSIRFNQDAEYKQSQLLIRPVNPSELNAICKTHV